MQCARLLFTALVLAVVMLPSERAVARTHRERLTDYVRETIHKRHIPAASAAIIQHQKTTLAVGIGKADLEIPVLLGGP